jgi:L-galactose dehydrogenase
MPQSGISARREDSSRSGMQYRTLGQTGLELSVIGFGASPLGDVFGPIDAMEGARAVHLAIDEGINFFDVSPYYGQTLAEERLGNALRGKRDKVVLATKCGRYGPREFDFSARRVRFSLEESLRRLHTDQVDLLQAHDVEFGDTEQIIQETIPVMRRLQEEGKVRYIGITGYPLKVLVRIAESVPVDCILNYCHYNLLNEDMDSGLMPFAERHGIGVINASPLHMGMLTEHGAPDWHPALPEIRSAVQKAWLFCREHKVDLTELALRFCFDYLRVASTLVGMCTTEQVRRNLHALQSPADEEMLAKVKTILAPVSNLVWPSGRPENHD